MPLLFGHGYLGSRVARLWQAAGRTVYVVTRSADRARELETLGYTALVADVTDAASLGAALGKISVPDTVLYAVGYERSARAAGANSVAGVCDPGAGNQNPASQRPATEEQASVSPRATCTPSIHDVYAGGLSNVLAALPAATGRVIYISTTGVYSQSGGEVVDEDSPTEPTREGGRASLAAEQSLAASSFASRGIVLRLAGIYGPGRIPLAEKLRRGEPLAVPAAGCVNLIHVDDAARVVLSAESLNLSEAVSTGIYNVSDGHPAIRGQYYAELARLLGAPPPRFTTPDAGAPATSRASSDKRISNARLLRELAIRLRYPTYREGLQAIVEAS